MSPQRAALAALVLVGICLASPAPAQVGPRPMVVYPLSAGGPGAGDVRDVESLLDAALHRAVQRSAEIVLAQPLVARAACGPAASATAQCLAGLTGGGLVLRVAVHRSQSTLVVMLEAVDARARIFGPVTVSVDAFAQSSEPLTHGVLILVAQAAASSRPRADLRPAEPPVPQPAPVRLAKPAPPSAQPGAWMRTAGPWLTGAGIALLGGGVAVSVMNRSLSDELDRKYAAGTLGAGDLASYRRVEQYNTVTQILLASGGAFTLAGTAIWSAAPERGRVVAGVAGRF
jgi:hypothetical protein